MKRLFVLLSTVPVIASTCILIIRVVAKFNNAFTETSKYDSIWRELFEFFQVLFTFRSHIESYLDAPMSYGFIFATTLLCIRRFPDAVNPIEDLKARAR